MAGGEPVSKGVGLSLKYFVLNPYKKTPYGVASRVALKAYADEVRAEDPRLASDIEEWLQNIVAAHRFEEESYREAHARLQEGK